MDWWPTPMTNSCFSIRKFQQMFMLVLLVCISLADTSFGYPSSPAFCKPENSSDCFVTNSYGEWNTRQSCRVSKIFYPKNETELLEAVAYGSKNKLKMKAVSKFSHSIPPLACPGGNAGVLISTEMLKGTIIVNKSTMTIEVDAGVQLRELLEAVGAAGLALPASPYYTGLSIAGIIGTGSHGSSRRLSALHDHVVGLRLVVPVYSSDFSRVLELESGDLFDAVIVSLGVLGVVSRVTLKLEPLFKRSVTLVQQDDHDLEEKIRTFGDKHEFGDVTWYPSKHRALYRMDDRVPLETKGDGFNEFLGFQPILVPVVESQRALEEHLNGKPKGKCLASAATLRILQAIAYGWKNYRNGFFTGYPIVGQQHNMQAAGGCERSSSGLLVCPWDPSHKGLFYFEAGFTIATSQISEFIRDVKKLRDAMDPSAMCGLDLYTGILLRYVGASRAILGKQEPGVDVGFTYFRTRKPGGGSPEADIWAEIEQMAAEKYSAVFHWGKNRPISFSAKHSELYPRKQAFVSAMKTIDPQRLFSSEWSDAVLGISALNGLEKYQNGCALEGLCICSRDEHCAPEQGYYCRTGRIFTAARVCRFDHN